MLTEAQRQRYARHIALAGIGEAGVSALVDSSVLIVGAGGLGSPAALYLCAAGIGRLGVVDDDVVSVSNLQRQIIHGEDEEGSLKVASAAASLKAINSALVCDVRNMRLNRENAADVIAPYDIVLDCTDGLDSKLLINDACVAAGKPFVHGSVLGWYGQLMTYVPGKGPCYRCLVGNKLASPNAPTCKTEGIAGPLVGVIGSLQALEALKYLTHAGELLIGRLLTFDGAALEFEEISVPRNLHCPACGEACSLHDLQRVGCKSRDAHRNREDDKTCT